MIKCSNCNNKLEKIKGKVKFAVQLSDDENLSPCPKCNCMTKSIRLSRAKYKCGKCGYDKTLSDVFFYEATRKLNEIENSLLKNNSQQFSSVRKGINETGSICTEKPVSAVIKLNPSLNEVKRNG